MQKRSFLSLGPLSSQLPELLNELTYELIDGRAIFYKDYELVLNGSREPEGIKGSSGLKALIVSKIFQYFLDQNPDKYLCLCGEPGLFIDFQNRLVLDIMIYKRPFEGMVGTEYLDIPPQLAIMVDHKANIAGFDQTLAYIHCKINTLMDFGLPEVLWVFTKSRLLIQAVSGKTWRIRDWDQSFKVLDTYDFQLDKLLDEEDMDLD